MASFNYEKFGVKTVHDALIVFKDLVALDSNWRNASKILVLARAAIALEQMAFLWRQS